ncbi:hypothetical protein [Nonomuraea sp. NPDC049684]|uniref:hypothetical protein n=1 Tax=Nonomuraea sp. NPDC049684 TaxID=3364356 RepID=UPI0037A57196
MAGEYRSLVGRLNAFGTVHLRRADVKTKEPIARAYYDLEFGRFMDEFTPAERP